MCSRRRPAHSRSRSDRRRRVGEWLIDGCSVLPRGATPAAIAGAARAARAGLVATSAAFAAEALRYERVGERRSTAPGFETLTPRERQVLAAMSNGLGNREIGGVLGISAHTAKFHVAQIIAKLQAQSRAHAVAKALRAGFVDV
jgi:DNA-binding NarL/FixJ family response regulator